MTSTMRRWGLPKLLFVFFVSLFAVVVASPALAQDASKLVIVVEGGGGDALANAIAKTLPEPWTRADGKAFAKAAKTRKVGGAKALDATKTRGPYIDRLLQATSDVKAGAVLVVRVPAAKKNRTAKVLLLAAGDKKPRTDTTVKLGAASPPKDGQAIGAAIFTDLPPVSAAAPVQAGKTPTPDTSGAPPATPPATPASGDPAKPSEPTASTDPSSAKPDDLAVSGTTTPPPGAAAGEAPLLLDASLGVDFSSRHFKYNDPVTTNLRPYDVDFVPTPAVKLELYPLAKSNAGVMRDIGLYGDLHAAIGLDSQAPDGSKIATTWTRVDAGLRFRFRFGKGKLPPQLGLRLAYGRETFAFRDQGLRIRNELPTVGYQVAQIGFDGRVPVGPIALFGGFAYLPVLRSGDVGKRIRGQSVGAVEAELGVAVPLGKLFEVRASADYRRYFFSFQPEPGDAVIAGGALDEMLRAQLAFAFVY